MEIKINLEEMTDAMIEWFYDMLESEIDDAKGTAENEDLWAIGSNNEEEELQHIENAKENREYAEFLESIVDEINYFRNWI